MTVRHVAPPATVHKGREEAEELPRALRRITEAEEDATPLSLSPRHDNGERRGKGLFRRSLGTAVILYHSGKDAFNGAGCKTRCIWALFETVREGRDAAFQEDQV